MRRTIAPLVACLFLAQALLVVVLSPAPASADVGDTDIALYEHVVWENGSRNLTGKVSVFGTLTVRNYQLWFELENDGEASIWVMDTGVLEFDNVTLKPWNSSRSEHFFIKVEGRFVAEDSVFEHLTGEFVSGGGIKCVDGTVELTDTRISNCEVQGVYVEGSGGSAVLDNVTMEHLQYGVHVKDGGSVTVRNGCHFDLFTKAGVLVNIGSADVSNSTFFGDRTNETRGIAVRGGVLVSVSNTVIHECFHEGITLDEETSAGMYSVEVYNCTVGIKMSSSSAVVKDCHIHDCIDGLNLYLSDPKVRQSVITDNFNGVASKDCSPGAGGDGL